MHRFFPTSSVLTNSNLYVNQEDQPRLRWIESHWNAFLQLSKDIMFIANLSSSDFLLGVKIRQVLLFDLLPVRNRWEYALEDDPVLNVCGSEIKATFLASLYRNHYTLATQIHSAPAFLQLRVCRLLFGDISRFCSRKV